MQQRARSLLIWIHTLSATALASLARSRRIFPYKFIELFEEQKEDNWRAMSPLVVASQQPKMITLAPSLAFIFISHYDYLSGI